MSVLDACSLGCDKNPTRWFLKGARGLVADQE